jgi:hypothetical protein
MRHDAGSRFQVSSGRGPSQTSGNLHFIRKIVFPAATACPSDVPRVGFIVTNLACSAEGVAAFYNRRSRTLGQVPNGRGRGAATDVCRHLFADHPAAGAAGAGMTSVEPGAPNNIQGTVCVDASEFGRLNV